VSLTGQKLPPVAEVSAEVVAADHGEGFQVVEAPAGKSAAEEAKDSSRRHLLRYPHREPARAVRARSLGLDEVRDGPKTNPRRQHGEGSRLSRSGESSRLDVAKRDLVKALGGIKDGGVFNLVLFRERRVDLVRTTW
jgi:hypothetical protein